MVYGIAQDKEGILYFGVSKGVMVYDGATWESYELNKKSEVRSLEYDAKSDRVYVGGMTSFGYLEKTRQSRYRYVPLSDSIFRQHPFREIWQVFVIGDSALFQCNEGYFIYANQSVSFLPLHRAYIYRVDDRVYISQTNGRLHRLKGDRVEPVWDQTEITREAAYGIIPWDDEEDLVIFPSAGAVRINHVTRHIRPFDYPLSDLVKHRWVYQTLPVGDELLAVATWQDGVFITDRAGNVKSQYGPEQGLQGQGIYDMELDQEGRLWLALDYGISFINLRPKFEVYHSEKGGFPIRVSSLEAGAGPRQFTIRPTDTLMLSRVPLHVDVQFSRPSSEFGKKTFQYLLEGYDAEWKETAKNAAEFRDLPRGTYLFRVRQTDEPETPEGRLVIIVDPPWYAVFEGRAGNALALIIVLAGLALFIVIRSRQTRRTLSRLVREKTAEIEHTKQELIQSNRTLLETNEELDTFLYRSSHDLVAPVKSIRGLIQLTRMSPEDRELYMEMMEERILKLENLLHEINNYVRHTRQGNLATQFYAHELVASVWSEIEFMDQEHHVNLIKEVDARLHMVSDANAWRMILGNLLSNAIKYRDLKKTAPFVKLAMHTDGGRVLLTVEDNGVGIPKISQERVFEMFYRAHETNSGSGLGLFLVKRMVDRLGGQIQIHSEFGKGTTVSVSCPLQIVAEQPNGNVLPKEVKAGEPEASKV